MAGRPPKLERNKKLVKLRDKNPKKYSYGVLGEFFNISKIRAREIYLQEKEMMSKR